LGLFGIRQGILCLLCRPSHVIVASGCRNKYGK
jgi:hypothetical protein